MKYYVSSITDVISEEADGDWEKLTYVDRTAELVSAKLMREQAEHEKQ